MKSFLRLLRRRILALLWDILPKKRVCINGVAIKYVKSRLFQLMYWNSSQGMCTPCTNGELLIFVVDPGYRFLRYVLYHEYREGMILHSQVSNEEILEAVVQKYPLICEVLRLEELKGATQERVKYIFRKWVSIRGAHAQALIEEIELAKKELPESDWIDFVSSARSRF